MNFIESPSIASCISEVLPDKTKIRQNSSHLNQLYTYMKRLLGLLNVSSKNITQENFSNYFKNHSFQDSNAQKSFRFEIPITTINIASLSVLFALVLLGTYYIFKLMTHEKCNCKLCKGNYTIIEKICSGGFGEIYKVKSYHNGNECILKRCYASSIVDADSIIKEAKHMRSLSHKNIVKYIDDFIHVEYVRTEPILYIVIIMEYCACDLKQLIDKRYESNKPFTNEEIIDMLIEICDGLNYIHQKKLIHRDIKSQNIFFSLDGLVRIGDFGLARKNKLSSCSSIMTKVGTDAYMAPEVIKNKKSYGSSADVWSLGCVIVEMCTLYFIWQYECVVGVEAMLNDKFIDAFLKEIPEEHAFFRGLLSKIFVVDPEKRDSVEAILYKLKKEKKRLRKERININSKSVYNII